MEILFFFFAILIGPLLVLPLVEILFFRDRAHAFKAFILTASVQLAIVLWVESYSPIEKSGWGALFTLVFLAIFAAIIGCIVYPIIALALKRPDEWKSKLLWLCGTFVFIIVVCIIYFFYVLKMQG